MWICEIEGLREHGRLIKRVGHEWRTEHFDDCRLIKIAKNRGRESSLANLARPYRENLDTAARVRIEFAGSMKRKTWEALMASRDFAGERTIVDCWLSKLTLS